MNISAAVIQLKALCASAVDEQLSSYALEKMRILQKILVYAVSIIFTFMDFHSVSQSMRHLDISGQKILKDDVHELHPSDLCSLAFETRLQWQRKAAVLVMETGGVNWVVGKVCLHHFFTSTYSSYLSLMVLLAGYLLCTFIYFS